MRNTLILLLAIVLCVSTVGCRELNRTAESKEPLVPTGAELETLRAFQLDPASPQGQKKIRTLRVHAEKIEKARANVTYWAEEARKRAEEEARRTSAGN